MNQTIVYVLKSAGLCGGVRVVLEHVSRLYSRGYDVRLFYIQDSPSWFPRHIPATKFDSEYTLIAALRKLKGIKIATWFETAFWIAQALNEDDRGYYLIQDIEDSYFVLPQQKAKVLESYQLGLKPITEARWVTDQLLEKFGQQAVYVSIGVDFDTYKPLIVNRDRFRVLTQSRVWSAGPNLKGWGTAKLAIEKAFELDRCVSLVTFSLEPQQYLRPDLPHIHLRGPDDKKVNELYNTSGLYLLTSNHEGFGLTAAEAMATGIPVVATLADGNNEFCLNGRTALTADKGDIDTLAQHILTIFHQPEYADAIARQGHEFIKQYTWDRVIDALEDEFFYTKKSILRISTKPAVVSTGLVDCKIEYPIVPKRISDTKPLASVIVPTVNDCQQIETCISAIRATTNPEQIELIVVDDGTQDETILKQLEQLANKLNFKLIARGQNNGFSTAVNTGILNSNGDYVVLVNSDVIVMRNWLSSMIESTKTDEKIAIVGAKLLYPDGLIQHAGMTKAKNSLYFPHDYKHSKYDLPETCYSRFVWSVTGALFMITRPALEQLGALSTAFNTAWEDVDYCLRAWSNGWKVMYCADTVALHKEGDTRGVTPEQKLAKPLVWLEREKAGETYFVKKWLGLTYINDLSFFNS